MVRFFFWDSEINSYEQNVTSKSSSDSKTNEHENSSKTNQIPVKKHSWLSVFKYIEEKQTLETADIGVGDFLAYDELEKSQNQKQFLSPYDGSNIQSPFSQMFNRFALGVHRELKIMAKEIPAASISSVISVLFSHPFDVIKTEYQLVRFPRTLHTPLLQHQKFIYVLRDIYETKGFKGFYKNHMIAQSDSLSVVISMFWTFERVNRFLNDNLESIDKSSADFISGFLSATIPVMILHPMAVWRGRKEKKLKILKKYGPIASKYTINNMESWNSVYQGCFTLFLHMGTQNGLRFLFFNLIIKKLSQRKTTNDKATDTNPSVSEVDSIVNLSNAELLLAGAVPAVLADIIAYPFDVIRSRLIMNTLTRQQHHFDQTCRYFTQCVKLILMREQFSAFYAGITPCIIRSVVNTAIQFAVYEKSREWLRLAVFG